MDRFERKWKAGLVIRHNLPYGFIQDVDGTIVFYNRDYQALSLAGVKEFHFDPDSLGIKYEGIAENKFLITEDGKTYVGKFYYLYEDATSPLYLYQPNVIRYLMRLEGLLKVVVGKIGNAHLNKTFTKDQWKNLELRFNEMVKENDNEH